MAQNDPTISIQGTLKNSQGQIVQDGSYPVIFRLYHQASGGTPQWEEQASIQVAGGVYSHMLGSQNALDPSVFSLPVWLGVSIENFELSPRTPFSYSPYSFSVQNAQHAITADHAATAGEVACAGGVGDVKFSILNPTQFANQFGDCWVPMDGRAMDPGDALRQITGMTNVPQGGGMFLRAQDFENSNNDPHRDHNSPIASFQGHIFHEHTHGGSTNEAGNHQHFTGVIIGNDDDLQSYAKLGTWPINFPSSTHPDRVTGTASNMEGMRRKAVTNEAGNHSHTVTITNTGGPETRPSNLNFWIYIRIN